MERIGLNGLSYSLLGMLAYKSCTGYEISKMLEVFWQAKHSQIYPLLIKLEEEGYLSVEVVPQIGKPDKKVYSITALGVETLEKWIPNPLQESIVRDEFLAKIYSIWLAEPTTAVKLLEQRCQFFRHKVAERDKLITQMETEYGDELTNPSSPHFGRYLLFMRKLQMEQDEIDWCLWALRFFYQ